MAPALRDGVPRRRAAASLLISPIPDDCFRRQLNGRFSLPENASRHLFVAAWREKRLNHLAHLMLSPPDPDSRIGNLLGDFVHGSISRFPPTIAEGIRMHRAVDAFTDSHPSVGKSRRLLAGRFRHHSRIIVDVLYDHLLINQWARYEARPLDEFAEEIYALLKQRRETLSGPLHEAIPHLVRNRWLTRNRDLQGVEHSLRFLSSRLRNPVRMEGATREFVAHEAEFHEQFAEFFPEVLALSRTW